MTLQRLVRFYLLAVLEFKNIALALQKGPPLSLSPSHQPSPTAGADATAKAKGLAEAYFGEKLENRRESCLILLGYNGG